MSRALDVWERSEDNSQSAVTPFQTLMIQSIHTGNGWCESIICAQFFPLDEGGACHKCVKDLFLPKAFLKL